jgi:hypothetical protein
MFIKKIFERFSDVRKKVIKNPLEGLKLSVTSISVNYAERTPSTPHLLHCNPIAMSFFPSFDNLQNARAQTVRSKGSRGFDSHAGSGSSSIFNLI